MKTILRFSLVLLAAFTTMGSYAIDGDFLLNVKKGIGKKIIFSVNEIQTAKITIYDEYHNQIYSEKATGEKGIIKMYNLEEFPNGIFFLEVETDLKKVTHKIVVSDENTSLSRGSIAEVYKGELKMKNDNVATTN